MADSTSAMPERIETAAILFQGNVYTGRNHALIIAEIRVIAKVDKVIGEQGFVTDTGRFVSRIEAGRIALACGQISHLRYPAMGLDSGEISSTTPV